MNTHGFSTPGLLTLMIAVLTSTPLVAGDAAASVGDLRIERPWSRVTPPGTPVGAGYMTILNTADEPDRLLAAGSPAAGRVQIHRSVKKDGTSSMVHQEGGVVVPPDGRIEFSPGGYHLMLMQLEAPLEQGERVPVILRFEQAGRVEVQFMVRSLTAGPPGDD